MEWVKRGLNSDGVFEVLVIIWIVAGPIAIAGWVEGMEDAVTWAAFIAGVIGVAVGWFAIAPYQQSKLEPKPKQPLGLD
jgi:hypothetical protein